MITSVLEPSQERHQLEQLIIAFDRAPDEARTDAWLKIFDHVESLLDKRAASGFTPLT